MRRHNGISPSISIITCPLPLSSLRHRQSNTPDRHTIIIVMPDRFLQQFAPHRIYCTVLNKLQTICESASSIVKRKVFRTLGKIKCRSDRTHCGIENSPSTLATHDGNQYRHVGNFMNFLQCKHHTGSAAMLQPVPAAALQAAK